MASIVDDRGYNQGFVPTKALAVRTERRFQAMLAEMRLTPSTSIIELGCGTGELSHLLAERTPAQVLGADLCEAFIRDAADKFKHPKLSFKVLDLSQPGVVASLARQFDYVVGNGILHHLYDQLDDLLPNLKKLLKPGGRLIFWEPNLYNPYVFLIFKIPFLRAWARLEPGEMAFTRRGLSARFRRAGYPSVNIAYRDFLTPNTPDALIRPVLACGALAERLPVIKILAQSVFVSAGVG